MGEPIKLRRVEFDLRPSALEDIAAALQLTRKALDLYRGGDERYNHLAEADIQKVQQTTEQTHKWLEEKRAALAATPRTQNPPITVSQLRQEKQVKIQNYFISDLRTLMPSTYIPTTFEFISLFLWL